MKIIFGIAFNWNETGTEGPIPAVQNKEHINTDGTWSHNGLITLKSGDRLIIYDEDFTILYGKVLDMQVPLSTTTSCRNEVPAPAHLSRKDWKEFYDLLEKEHSCVLVRG